jgi:hypothetical protein
MGAALVSALVVRVNLPCEHELDDPEDDEQGAHHNIDHEFPVSIAYLATAIEIKSPL